MVITITKGDLTLDIGTDMLGGLHSKALGSMEEIIIQCYKKVNQELIDAFSDWCKIGMILHYGDEDEQSQFFYTTLETFLKGAEEKHSISYYRKNKDKMPIFTDVDGWLNEIEKKMAKIDVQNRLYS